VANDAFPTAPLGLGPFEEWNFDSAAWDSDPWDTRSGETPARNSGTRLLEIFAQPGGYYLFGHGHFDQRSVYDVGSRLGPHRVQRRVDFLRTTTASGGVVGHGYWGYRLLRASGPDLALVDYAPEIGLGSIPSGNLWQRERRGTRVVHQFSNPGEHPVRLELVDEAGARRVIEGTVRVRTVEARGCGGCQLGPNPADLSRWLVSVVILLSLIAIGLLRPRRAIEWARSQERE
jgi:hypothetical protein